MLPVHGGEKIWGEILPLLDSLIMHKIILVILALRSEPGTLQMTEVQKKVIINITT